MPRRVSKEALLGPRRVRELEKKRKIKSKGVGYLCSKNKTGDCPETLVNKFLQGGLI